MSDTAICITLTHGKKKMTDEEYYKYVQELYKKHPSFIMNPDVWKEKRLRDLEQEGKLWSK